MDMNLPALPKSLSRRKLRGTAAIMLLAVWVVLAAIGSSDTLVNAPEGSPAIARNQDPLTDRPASGTSQDEATAGSWQTAVVTRVVDGDTLEVMQGETRERVRMIGIDTPERGDLFFTEATEKTRELCEGREVRLARDVSDRDRYHRILAYVYAGKIFVNAELVKQGFAKAYTYPPDVRHSQLFVNLEAEARENGRGLWAQTDNP